MKTKEVEASDGDIKFLRNLLHSNKDDLGRQIISDTVLEILKWRAESASQSKWVPVTERLLGHDNPYPLVDVLRNLKWATEYLLHKKDYDGHNYEELNQCVARAEEIIIQLELPSPPQTPNEL